MTIASQLDLTIRWVSPGGSCPHLSPGLGCGGSGPYFLRAGSIPQYVSERPVASHEVNLSNEDLCLEYRRCGPAALRPQVTGDFRLVGRTLRVNAHAAFGAFRNLVEIHEQGRSFAPHRSWQRYLQPTNRHVTSRIGHAI